MRTSRRTASAIAACLLTGLLASVAVARKPAGERSIRRMTITVLPDGTVLQGGVPDDGPIHAAEALARRIAAAGNVELRPCEVVPAVDRAPEFALCGEARHDVWGLDRLAEPALFGLVREGQYDVLPLSAPPTDLADRDSTGVDVLAYRIGRSGSFVAEAAELEIRVDNGAPYRSDAGASPTNRRIVMLGRRIPGAVPATELARPGGD